MFMRNLGERKEERALLALSYKQSDKNILAASRFHVLKPPTA